MNIDSECLVTENHVTIDYERGALKIIFDNSIKVKMNDIPPNLIRMLTIQGSENKTEISIGLPSSILTYKRYL